MKVLSVRQPWANLIVRGVKPVENRTWKTSYRGPLFIHAGKYYDLEGERWIKENFPGDLIPGEIFSLGGIIGQVEMVACVRNHLSPWFFGPWGFVFRDAKPISFFLCPGKLGFFDI